jgi:hypothetical protein
LSHSCVPLSGQAPGPHQPGPSRESGAALLHHISIQAAATVKGQQAFLLGGQEFSTSRRRTAEFHVGGPHFSTRESVGAGGQCRPV